MVEIKTFDMKKNQIRLLGIIVLFLMVGCEKSEPLAFNSKSAITFDYGRGAPVNSTTFSFLGKTNPVGVIKVPMYINGFPTKEDRPFEVEVITDSITTASEGDYVIKPGVIHAERVQDTLFIEVPKTAKLDNEVLHLYLRVKANSDFDKGIIERQFYKVSWSNKAIMPTWGVYFRTFISSAGSTRAYRIFVETTGLTNFAAADFRIYGQAGAEVLGKKFGDYIRAWNAANPQNVLTHDDGTQMGKPIVPRY
ncbi:hypothetical protein GCM10022216_01290 [Sphingobacterium kyonggiense]|uniref:DUF4843 domain-containing protein n=2 Tax=Sphingobacterium kyonggiense TaxID=714075 RepID=A0ABP7Y6L1_9SPHI